MDCTTREEAHRKKINPTTEEISFDDKNNNNNAMQFDAGRKAERVCEAAFLSGRRKTRGNSVGHRSIDRAIDSRFLLFFSNFFLGVCVSLFSEIPPTRMTCCQTAVS